ncbi:hypothetical protein GCM10010191_80570 [Actinomadura vinacea]|uniref:t-SNARE coiled-coil homology domain-containing protein n=1 Tax=Actinomadura vinacea TaxID=115336 RepID=A0ABN3K9K2_9ACTN
METNHNFLQTGGQPVSDRMRELLARAAQDHVYEQRSQGQILDEIRQRLEGMEWLLREVREGGLGGLTGQLDGVRGQVEELFGRPPEWAEGLAEHIESVGERVKPVSELPALWADVGVVAENVDEGLTRIQTMIDTSREVTDAAQRADRRLDEVAKRLDRLQGSMEAASVRFNRLDKSLAEMGHRAELLEHSINGVTTRVDQSLGEMAERVEQGLEAVNGRVEGVGGRLDGLDGRLEGLSGKLDGRLDSLHTMITELVQRPVYDQGHRFDALEKRLADAVDPLIDELRARPDRAEIEATMEQLAKTAHEEFTRQADDVSRRIDDIEAGVVKQVGVIHDDVNRRVGVVQDEVGRRAETVQEAVTKQVTTVHEDVLKRLSTLEETMLALAEALLRPRRDGKD